MNDLGEKDIFECCNCLQAAMYWICKKNGMNPLFVLINGFSIEYGKKRGTKLWEILRLNTPLGFEEYYLSTCGLEFKSAEYKLKNPQELDFENSEAVLIWEDAYYCPWNDAYGKTHISHFCIAESYNDISRAFICNDPYLKKNEVVFPLAVLLESKYRVYEIKRTNIKNSIVIEDALKILFSIIKEEDIHGNYNRLVNDIRKAKKREDLFENDNPQNCNFNIFTKQISDCYKGLAFLFVHETRIRSRGIIYDLLIQANSIWLKINFILIRMNLKSKKELRSCDGLIDVLTKAESIDIEILKNVREGLWADITLK